ncbi:MAG: hypothetical protein LBL71_03405, partial [Endomicrobium sp.]|nr:hypothetical protein [Endomicrobium sp.]
DEHGRAKYGLETNRIIEKANEILRQYIFNNKAMPRATIKFKAGNEKEILISGYPMQIKEIAKAKGEYIIALELNANFLPI